VYGISGFCAGPLLGAVLTVAGASPNPLVGAALLFTSALGTAAPLFIIAWLWDRYRLGSMAWLRGTVLQLGPWRAHTTNLLAGLLLIAFGTSFIVFQGASVLSGLYASAGLEDLSFQLQMQVQTAVSTSREWPTILILVLLAGLGLTVAMTRKRA
jgi:hypothetical protein